MVSFTNLQGSIIKAEHLYIVDQNKQLLEVKYEKIREWWKNIFVESVTVMDQTTESDEQIMKPQVYLDVFRGNHTGEQPVAMYFKDIRGNMIEFTNVIKKCWVEDYVLGEKVRVIGANDILHYYVTSLVDQDIVVNMTADATVISHKDTVFYQTEGLPEIVVPFSDSVTIERGA